MSLRRLVTTLGSLLAVVLVAGILIPRAAHPPVPTPPAASSEAIPAPGLDDTWLTAVHARIASEEYRPGRTAEGLQAPNRAQDFRTRFHDRGIDVVPRGGAGTSPWQLAWTTTRWGHRDQLIPVEPVSAANDGSRVTYRRDGLDEWYENRPEGLEQGFTIHAAPGGSGSLCVVGRMGGALRPRLVDDQTAEFVDDQGKSILRYGGLKAWDTEGRDLPSRLSLDGTELVLLVDDSNANYPITIDPLLTSPSWSYETNQAVAEFGQAVCTAGDVNGDGYSDIAVGADRFDSGQVDAGRVFVFLGSAAGLDASPAWTMDGTQLSESFGVAVGPAGDVNGDGYDDLIVGAELYDNGTTDEGGAFLYLGNPGGLRLTPAWIGESNVFNVRYGCAVNTAGDVNGDGFADVIVGASSYDNDQSGEGRAFVYLGSASGLGASPAWTAESNQTGSDFASGVATAGDVNADGYADVIVGASGFDNGQTNEGRAYVYQGSASGLAATAAWIGEGNQANGGFGYSIGTAGDVNGDGYADVIVGARSQANGESSEGRVHVFLGSISGLAASPAWSIESNQAGAFLGGSVGTAGDVNADGYADVIVGASNYDNVESNEGGAWVYIGSATGLGTSPYWHGESNQATAFYGIAVSTAGDVNGDGRSEILVGAYSWDNGQSSEGAAFVYTATPATLADTPGWTGIGDLPNSDYGNAVACAGDVNGDGYSDIIVGAGSFNSNLPALGRVYAYYGSPTGPATVPSWMHDGDIDSQHFGFSVAGAGDVNGDGYSDVIVGAPVDLAGSTGGGSVQVFLGSPAGLGASPAWTVQRNMVSSGYGYSVSTAGDVNGDGYADVIVGDPGFMGFGQALIYLGSAAGLSTLPAWYETKQISASRYGASVSTAGDVDGNGLSDVIVGSPGENVGKGRVEIWWGIPDEIMSFGPDTILGDQFQSEFGTSVGTAGDINGDGYSDVIIGAPLYTNGQTREGRVLIVYGASGGLGSSSALEINQGAARFGYRVATAGDVDGDGYSDVLVIASNFNNVSVVDLGAAFVYRGSAAGITPSPFWFRDGSQQHSKFGEGAASAGDVNGDGLSEVLIGEKGLTHAYVYYSQEASRLDLVPRQVRSFDSAPIDQLGRIISPSSVLLKARGRSAAGRSRVRLQYDIETGYDIPYWSAFPATGPAVDTGAPGGQGSAVVLSGMWGTLPPNKLYSWRLRLLGSSPYFPRSRWLSPSWNGPHEADFRTSAAPSAVADIAPPSASFRLEAGTPNPFTTTTRLHYTLLAKGRTRLAVFDVAGREVARLADGIEDAGTHVRSWNGQDSDGQKLPAGVYFVRLSFGNEVTSRKIVLTR